MCAMRSWLCVAALGALIASSSVPAQPAASPQRIYTCTTPEGRRLTSDRPIPECIGREQRLLRRDGTEHATVPPAQSLQDKAAAELKAREEEAKRASLSDAIRHDRNLLSRFPRQARHDAARQQALDDLVKAAQVSEQRLKALTKERKVLDDEAEFYKGKGLPVKLKQQIDANDAAAEAQRLFIVQQSEEKARVNGRYDVELARLKKLWGGAPPGSLGPAPGAKVEEPAPQLTPASSSTTR